MKRFGIYYFQAINSGCERTKILCERVDVKMFIYLQILSIRENYIFCKVGARKQESSFIVAYQQINRYYCVQVLSKILMCGSGWYILFIGAINYSVKQQLEIVVSLGALPG
eukprot:TRINITY_DN6643_c1_g1_i1.p1 TRINITY_DN6643_c1_g1~~TRINITY_DN6643_c1_g1_i1.p1  ORF type:complete len:111 (-),score=9.30 TRINITY_DN6643_c1_g1_i1:83-415(-)